ncbi:ABC transporter ATP-binding protein [Cohnella sp. JJ-181]|uniref:ABC transporter ATP-binding protein n=1 Tax=Cohnella rhizoplanae TaxID=2974897 RepID=UPI00232F0D4E|nr:ABC transporter ATP-binding protein [Cohnella sp. JJ-181]
MLLSVRNLKTYYRSGSSVVPAVDGVSFHLRKGEVLGIVGESGCGKSTVARSLINLLDKSNARIEGGEVLFHGEDLMKQSRKAWSRIRGKKISMIFQNPQSALNPVYTVGDQIAEALTVHQKMSRKEARDRVVELLKLVGIPEPESRLTNYPHEMSGGMQQRAMIAIALACHPEIVIADEPTTALDVTIQAQILALMDRIRAQFQMGMILISHNMGIVAEMCDRIMVMYGGVVVEEGETAAIFAAPSHPYTKGLLASIPSLDEDRDTLYAIPGSVPRLTAPVGHCRFAGRCAYAKSKCWESEPPLIEGENGHRSRCWLMEAPDRGHDDERE